ncbi:DUF6155 family protein [Hymenobacter sp. H14-R3]|uniref:DUF6155 family protein n=1 Tax=Hymenobacter sp. H14-R3 TaxID=3046308 RepID=UPI0024BBAA7B|nr:DUF6155 family protein [Hymenobacter sp. H14-R3]MDJ0365220.1 DUF6155 family protein [Hymenobacter sp. H14-R3]
MTLADVKKELQQLEKPQLIALLSELYKKHKNVKEYLDFYVQPDEAVLLAAHRERVLRAFYPKRGYNYDLRVGKAAISDFRKLGGSTQAQADLMLYYVECGVRYTNDYGDINEGFYLSLEKMYEQALALMRPEKLLPHFAERSHRVVTDTSGMGWGFHDMLAELYEEYYAQ